MINQQKTAPYISIVLPTYNVGPYIDRCLASCTNQTFSDIEIIVVDDCGQDDSIAKAQVWAQKDARIKIVRNKQNLGTFHARRVGVANAKGRYVLFLDPDDSLTQDAAQQLAAATSAEQPDIVFYGTRAVLASDRGKKVKNQRPLMIKGTLHQSFIKAKPQNLGTPGKAYFTKTLASAFERLAVPATERLVYAEDVLILYAAILCASGAATLDQSLYCYQENCGSITLKKSLENIRQHQSQIANVIERIDALEPAKRIAKLRSNVAVRKHFVNKLKYDFHMLARHATDQNGNNLYLQSVVYALSYQPSAKGLVRMALYLSTFGKIKL